MLHKDAAKEQCSKGAATSTVGHTMPLYQLLQDNAFDPEHIEAMASAFEAVCRELGLAPREDPLRDLVAQHIIEFAKRGERDPAKLTVAVLGAIHGINSAA
jgi:hypothetical protein